LSAAACDGFCDSLHDVAHFLAILDPNASIRFFVLAAHPGARTMIVCGNKIVGFSSKKEIKCASMTAG
jgi:hypothetical protein